MTARNGIGVVLSSGGIRGIYAHTGFIQAIEELGISVSAIAGCSAGAVAGAVLASGAELEGWSDAIAEVAPNQFWTPAPWWRVASQLVWHKGRGLTGLSGTEAAIAFLQNRLAVDTFEACPIPFRALAMNLTEGRKSILKSGDLARGAIASAATPIVFKPVDIDGDLYCDGAVVNLASTEAICCEFGLSTLIVHHVSVNITGAAGMASALSRPWTMLEILGRVVFGRRPWYLTGEPLTIHTCPCGCGARVIVIEPKLPEFSWPKSAVWTQTQTSAKAQTKSLLAPHLSTLMEPVG